MNGNTMSRYARKSGLTLLEVVVVTLIFGVIITVAVTMSVFFIRQVRFNMERTNMWTQTNFTLDDMRVRCISAVNIATPVPTSATGGSFIVGSSNPGQTFEFEGESDIFNITPEDLTDNVTYRYAIAGTGGTIEEGTLILETISGGAVTDTVGLIDARYDPQVEFAHVCVPTAGCDEPNFIMVTITVSMPNDPVQIIKTEGVRFWFIEVI